MGNQIHIIGGGTFSHVRNHLATNAIPTGRKTYADQDDFWKKARHWPRFPTKPKDWRRDYRRKNGDAIERKFDVFLYRIHALTSEEQGRITSIKIIGTNPMNVPEPGKETLLKERTF